jgi:hypothetical protein
LLSGPPQLARGPSPELCPLDGTALDFRVRRDDARGMSRGQCLCGAVRFTTESCAAEYHACHCAMCRRWSGGAPFFATHAEGVRFEGDENLGRYASSEWAERGFCKQCGSTLFYFLKPAQSYMVSIGAFDDPGAFRLAREIFIDKKPSSYALSGDHPRWTEAETFAKLTPKS